MSSTNKTVTVELSQYVSTDKPTYLVDYNSDMLKIDNAIASDRGDITTAQNTATTADGKADANKTSIDNINLQLNGDPTDPSDTGLAGDVSAVEGNVNTINSLIGNGTPTTSDQTIIGAINNLEGSVAPREDSADMANSYVIGAKFARGGTLYEALSSITAGTAFASLVLNTDYKVADTLVKQIEDAASGSGVLTGIVNSVEESIAPREDGTTLTGSYSVGDQFIRAGVLYEALTSLTAGTAFASLTLNTDYKVADTLVEQIANAGLPSGYYTKQIGGEIRAVKDGVKTWKDLLHDAAGLVRSAAQALADGEKLRVVSFLVPELGAFTTPERAIYYDNTSNSVDITIDYTEADNNALTFVRCVASNTTNACIFARGTVAATYSYNDKSSNVAGSDVIMYYEVYAPFENA